LRPFLDDKNQGASFQSIKTNKGKTMKGLILAGLMSVIGMMGMAESAKALPEVVSCSVAVTVRGGDVNPTHGICAADVVNDVVTARFMDFMFVWGDRRDLSPTSMGMFQDGQDGVVMTDAYAQTSDVNRCAIGNLIGTTRTRVVTICVGREPLQSRN
jgi:hypothetical protein